MKDPGSWRRTAFVLLTLGLYLTLHGYHSRDGDQAYRLPLLINRQIPAVFANDPFVRAFDQFNPHRFYLGVLDVASRPFGLSVALAVLFALTFVMSCRAIGWIASQCWPERAARTEVVAVAMFLVAKAGNIGTNHLFEAMLLDRLIALGLGWLALANLVRDRPRGMLAAFLIGLATCVHPSCGLQLGCLCAGAWVTWGIFGRTTGVSYSDVAKGLALLFVAMIPGACLMAGGGTKLMDGLAPDDFFTLSALIQSPQHMIPHLWRMPQWLAWTCYPVLAGVTLWNARRISPSTARARISLLLAVTLLFLAVAWVAVECLGSISTTIFQPFRMATFARGLCLVIIADRARLLWDRSDISGRSRACLLVFGLVGDWSFVVATVVDLGAGAASRFRFHGEMAIGALLLVGGMLFLKDHDTESGHWPLLAGLCVALGSTAASRLNLRFTWKTRRVIFASAACWIVPVLAILPEGWVSPKFSAHCRFLECPADEIERLAVWCRENTPENARFVTPPGPKTFRLWSRREVAFNRAAGPYHAKGLADWAERFRDHVGFDGSISEFAQAYLKDRQSLERRFDTMDASQMAALARRQGASYVVAKSSDLESHDSLHIMHREGRYAVYRVHEETLAKTDERSSR